ncbi:MAG TPA: hypothetical protein P5017_04475 [Anaerohalosphaeraceae bacterium]|nr:hypothetical protein [Anaerohalosphaeraceae bacterium]
MKRRWLAAGAVVVFGLGVLVWAAESGDDSTTPAPAPKAVRPVRSRERLPLPRRVSMSEPNSPAPRASQRVLGQEGRDPMAALEARHQELTAELTTILNLAREENAVKTAEAIQKLIDKQNAEYQKNLKLLQERQAEMQRRLQQRLKEREQRASAAASSEQSTAKGKENKQTAESKKSAKSAN